MSREMTLPGHLVSRVPSEPQINIHWAPTMSQTLCWVLMLYVYLTELVHNPILNPALTSCNLNPNPAQTQYQLYL